MRVGLVGCVKSKRMTAAPAKDLYTSALFHGRRRWVEQRCDAWFILSAKHGLVPPEEILAPYDVTLTTMSRAGRRHWSLGVLVALESLLGDLGEHTFEIHAGFAYAGFGLADGLAAAGALVQLPTSGLSLGRQLQFYGRNHTHSAGYAGVSHETDTYTRKGSGSRSRNG